MAKDVVICVKQVPDVTEVKINPETHTLIREGVPSVLNPFDEFVVEEAVRIKEQYGGTVTAVTMGPPQAEEVLKLCLQMGADKGVLLCDQILAGSDTWATSIALAALLKKMKYDLIICGQETTDSSTAQIGPELAERIGIPQITFVNSIELEEDGKKGTFTRETDKGYQILESRLPLLVTVVKGINEPRVPGKGLERGKGIEKVSASDIGVGENTVGVDGSPTRVVQINAAKPKVRAQLVVDSSLPAHERIRLIMMGGIQQKEDSTRLDGEAADMAKRAGEFILDLV
jgi:electron transfer flavoprotein alpha/beta subunit